MSFLIYIGCVFLVLGVALCSLGTWLMNVLLKKIRSLLDERDFSWKPAVLKVTDYAVIRYLLVLCGLVYLAAASTMFVVWILYKGGILINY